MHSSTDKKGVALVIVLTFVVLLTGVVVAYFSRAMSSRQLSDSSVHLAAADELARSALEMIGRDIKKEITDGSTVTPDPNPNNYPVLYVPLSSINMTPARNITPAQALVLKTLLRRSERTDGTTLASPVNSEADPSLNGRKVSLVRWNKHLLLPRPTGAAADDSAPAPEFIAPDWVYVTSERPTPLSAAPAAGAAPVIGRYAYAIYDVGGLLDINVAGYPSTLPAAGPHPTPAPSGREKLGYAPKGAVAFADLTQLVSGGATAAQVDSLVGWRNFASARPTGSFPGYTFNSNSAAAYFDAVLDNKSGFLRTGGTSWTPPGATTERTDQLFLSRQELLDICGAIGISKEVLQYLTVFSRAVMTPTWRPLLNADQIPNYQSTMGTAVSYAADADKLESYNRNLSGVRLPAGITVRHYKDNGVAETWATVPGDLLIRQRFSLAKLAWIGADGPNAAPFDSSLTAADRDQAIYDCFGLVWDPTRYRWNYSQLPSSNVHIYTLAEVAAAGREPNFFELLRAGILSGSLGRDPGQRNSRKTTAPVSGTNGVMGDFNDPFDHAGGYNYKKEPNMQILQIGANIIDQSDTDGYPTAVHMTFMNGLSTVDDMAFQTAYGIENLPYLCRVGPLAIGDPRPTSAADTNGRLKFWVQPELWNPHQVPSAAPTQGPRNFRAYAYGSIHGLWRYRDASYHWGDPTYYDDGDGNGANMSDCAIYFSDSCDAASPFYNNPRLLTISPNTGVDQTLTSPRNLFDAVKYGSLPADAGNPNRFAAFYAGQANFAAAGPTAIDKFVLPNPIVYFCLHYQRPDGGWSPYNFMSRVAQNPSEPPAGSMVCNGYDVRGHTTWCANTGDGTRVVCRPDPRTDRFSAARVWVRDWMQNRTMNEAPNTQPGNSIDITPSIPGIKFDSTGSPYTTRFMNMWAVNDPNYPAINAPYGTFGKAYYADPDGVVRFGDSYRANIPEARFTPVLPRTGDGCELYHGNAAVTPVSTITSPGTGSAQARRPVVLNRPFRSVGELGFAYRDQPFKTLDFWSPTSADSALLELFTTAEEPLVVAAQLNINSAPEPVLKAILAGAAKNNESLNLQISPADAQTLAQAISADVRDLTSPAPNGPYLNRADLVTRTGEVIQTSFNTKVTATSNWANKQHGEGPIRALANVTNLRTWNLMVDVIAQTGVLKPGATDLKKFNVQGERRYWLHLAIDRYTGKVIERRLEAVYE